MPRVMNEEGGTHFFPPGELVAISDEDTGRTAHTPLPNCWCNPAREDGKDGPRWVHQKRPLVTAGSLTRYYESRDAPVSGELLNDEIEFAGANALDPSKTYRVRYSFKGREFLGEWKD